VIAMRGAACPPRVGAEDEGAVLSDDPFRSTRDEPGGA